MRPSGVHSFIRCTGPAVSRSAASRIAAIAARVAAEQAVAQVRLDDGARDDAVDPLRVAQGLVLGGGAADEPADDRDEQPRHDAGEREVDQCAPGVSGAVGGRGAQHGATGQRSRERDGQRRGHRWPPPAAGPAAGDQSAPAADLTRKPHRGCPQAPAMRGGRQPVASGGGPARGRAPAPSA